MSAEGIEFNDVNIYLDISEIEQLLTMCHRDNTKALLNNELSRLKSLSNAVCNQTPFLAQLLLYFLLLLF